MELEDRKLTCSDCQREFVFTAGEQEFFARKGFDELPRRCKACRVARKDKRRAKGRGPAGAQDHGTAHDGEASSRARPAREMFDATCASCGAPARVPFRPATGRPIYCRECYSSRQGQGSGYGGGLGDR